MAPLINLSMLGPDGAYRASSCPYSALHMSRIDYGRDPGMDMDEFG
jgi:hypothetical protein